MRAADADLTPGRTPVRYSLRCRLPFVMAASTGLVIAAVVAVGYREVKANLIQAAGIRAQATADQLAGLFVQSTQQRLNELQRIANHPTLRQLFEHPNNDTRDAARAHLGQIRSPGPQILDVWNAAGECVLTVAMPAAPSMHCRPARCRRAWESRRSSVAAIRSLVKALPRSRLTRASATAAPEPRGRDSAFSSCGVR
jgi:hypothetical protein